MKRRPPTDINDLMESMSLNKKNKIDEEIEDLIDKLENSIIKKRNSDEERKHLIYLVRKLDDYIKNNRSLSSKDKREISETFRDYQRILNSIDIRNKEEEKRINQIIIKIKDYFNQDSDDFTKLFDAYCVVTYLYLFLKSVEDLDNIITWHLWYVASDLKYLLSREP